MCAIFPRRFLTRTWLAALLLLLGSAAWAQTRSTATLRGQVTDTSGAAVAQAQVAVANDATGVTRSAETSGDGSYALASLSLTGEYRISVTKPGFATAQHAGIQLQAGQVAVLDFVLHVAGSVSTVTVYGTPEGVQTQTAQQETRFDLQKIENTPVLGRKLSTLPLLNSAVRPARGTGDLFLNNTLYVINGGGRRQTTYALDNATADDSWGRQAMFTAIPFTAVQEFTVLTNALSAEYGRTTGSAVNVVTKSGTNAFHGELVGVWRPGSLQARMPLASQRTADKLAQGSGTISGPLLRERTYFLLSQEYTAQDRDAVITSPLAPGIYTGNARQSLFLARLDHRITDANALSLRLNFDRLNDTNPADAVGGATLPSAARIFRRNTYSAMLSETATLSNHLVNEARV